MGSDVVNMTEQQALVQMATKGIAIVSRTIGPPVITGSGLDDFSNGGEFTGNSDVEYELEIVTAGTPDAFQLSRDGVVITASIPIDGSDQDLGFGVTGKFDATTGHDLGDIWTFTARAADPISVQKTPVNLNMPSLAPSGSVTFGPFDLRNVEAVALTIGLGFAGPATAGISVKALTSADGISYDTESDPYASTGLEPAFVAGTTVQKTSLIDTIAVKFMKIIVRNLDAAQGTGGQDSFITKVER